MSGLTHLDLDVLFGRSEGGYRVQILRSPAGDGQSVTFARPFTDLELENFVLRVGRYRAQMRRVEPAPVAAAKLFGGKLFDAVFVGAVGECLRRSLDRAREEQAALRIRLRLSDCSELASLPWELLYDRGDDWFLALSDRTPVVRYVQLPVQPRALHVALPLRVLVIRSEPVDYPHLDLVAEWAQVAAALGELTDAGRSRSLNWLPRRSASCAACCCVTPSTFCITWATGGSISSVVECCCSPTGQDAACRLPPGIWACCCTITPACAWPS